MVSRNVRFAIGGLAVFVGVFVGAAIVVGIGGKKASAPAPAAGSAHVGSTATVAPSAECSAAVDCDKACKANDQPACVAYAKMLADGNGVTKDVAAAHALFEAACTANSGEACRRAGKDFEVGAGVGKDPATARVRWEKSCNLGYA
ncbi:MAG TPA: hypothetical protein VGM39_13960, partial [Kofleriaceae bacterium]